MLTSKVQDAVPGNHDAIRRVFPHRDFPALERIGAMAWPSLQGLHRTEPGIRTEKMRAAGDLLQCGNVYYWPYMQDTTVVYARVSGA